MQRFNTLLLREWMQHRTGWLVLMTVPFVLALLGAIFGDVKLRLGAPDVHVQMGGMPIQISEGALPMAVFALGGTALLTQSGNMCATVCRRHRAWPAATSRTGPSNSGFRCLRAMCRVWAQRS